MYATHSGTAEYKFEYGYIQGIQKTIGYGNYVYLTATNDNGVEIKSVYAHCSEFSNGMGVTQLPSSGYYDGSTLFTGKGSTIVGSISVTKGSIIAKSENVGQSSGPHLHYEFRLNNVYDDPYCHVLLPGTSTCTHSQQHITYSLNW